MFDFASPLTCSRNCRIQLPERVRGMRGGIRTLLVDFAGTGTKGRRKELCLFPAKRAFSAWCGSVQYKRCKTGLVWFYVKGLFTVLPCGRFRIVRTGSKLRTGQMCKLCFLFPLYLIRYLFS